MKLSNVLKASVVAGILIATNPCVSDAEYVTAYEEVHYEKYVLDTNSFYYPDKKHKLAQFNCLVWCYTDKNDENKKKPYTFRYRFVEDHWELAEQDGDKLVWAKFDNNSPASYILRVALPYINNRNDV